MVLKMYVGNTLIDEWEVNFNYCTTDKQKELERMASQMYWHHWHTFKATTLVPVFYFHIGSKMNCGEYEEMSLEDLKVIHSNESTRSNKMNK